MEIKWKVLGTEDEEIIKPYYDAEPMRNCEFTFANNILWAPFYGIRYAIVEEMLVFISDEAKMSISFPLGKGNLKKTIDILTEYFRELDKPFKLHLVSPTQFERLEMLYPGRFQVEYDRDSADYVYEAERLTSLAGKKLHAKRNHINRFKENNPDWQYEKITDDNVQDCIKMAEEWRIISGCPDKGPVHDEFCVTLHALRDIKELDLQGGLIRAGGKVVAFSIGEPCGEDMFVVHIEKAYPDIQGAYPIINQEFVKNEAAGYRYINREEDTGDEGLRKAKLSYAPVFLLEKGLVTEVKNSSMDIAHDMLTFIKESPSCYQVIENAQKQLKEDGYVELFETEEWELSLGGKYYLKRNDSSMIAFHIPQEMPRGFHMIASHSDSPGFKLKEAPEITVEEQYVKLNVEKYGGMIMSTWLDRPLSVAGRVVVKNDDKTGIKTVISKPVMIDEDLLIIPNVAIHMNRDVNKGMEFNAQTDMLPLYGGIESEDSFMELIAEAAGVDKEKILGSDLFLYNREDGRICGAEDEFICAPRLDDLACVYASLQAMRQSEPKEYMNVLVLYDNEEVGSMTRQGASSTFLKDTIQRISEAFTLTKGDCCRLLADSFLISADNAHAVHPNHPEKSDPTNRPYLNGGIVIKYHGSQKYTTDAISSAVMKEICKQAEVPYQTYANRSDITGGSTLGNISATQVPVNSVDIGIAQLAMHSAYETAGSKDIEYMIKAMSHFYQN